MTVRTRWVVFVVVIVGAVALGTFAYAQWLQRPDGATTPTAHLTPTPDPVTGEVDASTFRNIAADRMPMVVSIRTTRTAEAPAGRFFNEDALRQFFGLPELPDMPRERVLEGAGSGFIISADGLVLTNSHVVQDATRIEVALFPDPAAGPGEVRRLQAQVLGRDALTDSALLKIEGASDLPTATFGDSDAIRPGDWVMAIGNPFALSHTVTVGVISATARPFPLEGRPQRVLQTDAAINPGNSGGPLFNLRGEIIGINTAIFSPVGAAGGNVGIGFAVPINLIEDLIPRLREGNVRRGRLGVSIRSVPEGAADQLGLKEVRGALVSVVESEGPADDAGLEPGDVILEFRRERIDSADELVSLVSNSAPGEDVMLRILRAGKEQSMNVTLGEIGANEPTSRRADTTERLGMSLQTVPAPMARQSGIPASEAGALVAEVTPGSPAADAGLEAGDVILQVNREPMRGLSEVTSELADVEPGESAFLLVFRGGQRMFLVLTRPD